MLNKINKGIATILSVTLFVISGALAGAEMVDYSHDRFLKAQEAGKTIVVAVHADWCSTCKKQTQIMDKLYNDPVYEEVVFLRVDYDQDKKLVRKFKVIKQSTLIIFSGEREIARSMGETDVLKIRALIDQGK